MARRRKVVAAVALSGLGAELAVLSRRRGYVLGSNTAQGTDLPRMMQELTDAARSVRALADYLDRHPEALIRGKKKEPEP